MDKKINIAIVGSRDFVDYKALDKFVQEHVNLTKIEFVVSGGAKGADKLAEQFANHHSLGIRVIYPNWQKYGKKAGFLRNKLIIEASNIVFAFWDGESRGTLSSINLAKEANKELYIYRY